VDCLKPHFPDKLAEVVFSTRLRGIVFPIPRYYQFTLLADGEWVAQRRLRIERKEG